jgi:hypothetical protein
VTRSSGQPLEQVVVRKLVLGKLGSERLDHLRHLVGDQLQVIPRGHDLVTAFGHGFGGTVGSPKLIE